MLAHAMPGPVETAISRASDLTGVDAAFLLGEAQRESRFDPKALAPTSSASGLFQFIDQTWLATLKRHGSQFGYARYASLIRQSPDGRYVTDDATARAAVMSLRLDPRAASLMAGEMAADHAAWLNQKMGRPPTAGELYAAHFLGREGAAQLVELATLTPGADAAQAFPGPARANPTLFRKAGQAVSVSELYAELTAPPPAYGAHVNEATQTDPFLRYAAARRAERTHVHHAVFTAALVRQRQAVRTLVVEQPVVAASAQPRIDLPTPLGEMLWPPI